MKKNSNFENQLVKVRENLNKISYSFTRNKEEREDLVQETLTKALEKQHLFKEDINLIGWLRTIMQNIYISNYRKNKNNVIIISNDHPSFINLQSDNAYYPEKQIQYNQVLTLIDNLPNEQRTLVKMHEQGYKYKEIAQMFNIPLGTIKSRIHTAKQTLMQQLAA